MDVMEKNSDLYKTVGQRIRERRRKLRITQTQLADLIGISYQQVQKYEAGLNHLSLERLMQFAKLLSVSPDHFYQGIRFDDGVGSAVESDVIRSTTSQRLRILLVEDNMADVLLFKKSMEKYTKVADLYCIDDPERVMDYLCNHMTKYGNSAPDIMVLDLNMPKVGGLKLLKDLKSNSQNSLLPVIVLTNSISRKEMQEAYRLGAAGFIQKSINFEEYRESIGILINYWSKVVVLPMR